MYQHQHKKKKHNQKIYYLQFSLYLLIIISILIFKKWRSKFIISNSTKNVLSTHLKALLILFFCWLFMTSSYCEKKKKSYKINFIRHTHSINIGVKKFNKKKQQTMWLKNATEKNRLWVCLKKSFLSFSSWQSHLHNIKK